MIKKLLNTFLTLLLISCAQHAHAIEPMQNKSMFINGYPESAQISSLRLDFEALGFTGYKLDGVNNNSRVDFTNRIDKLSTNLKLNFSYTNSPALIANVSHLKVYFNDKSVETFDSLKDAEAKYDLEGVEREETEFDVS